MPLSTIIEVDAEIRSPDGVSDPEPQPEPAYALFKYTVLEMVNSDDYNQERLSAKAVDDTETDVRMADSASHPLTPVQQVVAPVAGEEGPINRYLDAVGAYLHEQDVELSVLGGDGDPEFDELMSDFRSAVAEEHDTWAEQNSTR